MKLKSIKNRVGEAGMKSLLVMIIFVLVGVLLFGPIVNTVKSGTSNSNATTDQKNMLNIVPILYVVALLIGVVAYALKSFDII